MFDTTEPTDVELPAPPVSKPAKRLLDEFGGLHADSYRDYKTSLLSWLQQRGKVPERGKGYAPETVRVTHYKIEHAYRWKWEDTGEFTTTFTPEDADELIQVLFTRTDKTDNEIAKYQKALKRLFAYKTHAEGHDYEWDPEPITTSYEGNARHYFKKHEMNRLYQAALDYGSFVSYTNKSLTSEDRERAAAHLAQRFGKPKSQIGPKDFDRATSWKIPSLIAMTCDMGLRPDEVANAKVGWLNTADREVTIPKEEASKDDAMWECTLSSQGASALDRWLAERQALSKYRETDAIWLTRQSNPYGSKSLNHILNKLIEAGGIEPRNRDLSWYSIRRGVATVWANEEGIHNAKEQLRHKNIETTLKYVNTSLDVRREMADNKW
jgi:integrase